MGLRNLDAQAACEENALALQYASDRWRSDKE